MKPVKTSLFVGVSAFFRVLLAQRIFEMFDLKMCIAFSLLVLFVYVLDRSFDFKSWQSLLFAFSLFAIAVFLSNGLFAPVFALIIGLLYSKGINGFRLKKGYGIKNMVTGLTWGIVVAFYSSINTFTVTFFTIKSVIITVLNDFKDIEDDMRNGIKTIPVIFKDKAVYLLLSIHLILHILIPDYVSISVYLFSLLFGLFSILKIKPKLAQGEFIFQSFLIEINNN